MSYGVWIEGRRPPSKKAIIDAMRINPEGVTWQNDNMFSQYAGQSFRSDELPKGTDDVFCGPDPHTNRKFYGQVKVDQNGKVTVK